MDSRLDIYQKEGTVLKLDMSGFSTFSEGAETHQMREVPYQILGAANAVAMRHGGVALKRDGDATTVSFNVEQPLKDLKEGAVAATRSSLKMQEKIEEKRKELGLGGDTLRARIGISTGRVEFGGYYEGDRFLPDINGFPMSVATRLESSAELGTVRVDQRTRELADRLFEWEDLGEVPVKGLTHPIHVYRPVREIHTAFDVQSLKDSFFGRAETISRIRQYLKTSKDLPVVLIGEPGIGKTATAKKALGPHTLLKFSPPDRTDPNSGLRNFYRTVFGDDLTVEKLTRLGLKEEYPFIALPLGISVSGYDIPTDPDVRRMKTMEAYYKVRGIINTVLSDDVQWAPPFWLDLVRSSPTGIVNVLTARPEFEPDFPVEKIEIGPLERKDLESILKEILGDHFSKLDGETVCEIVERTKGNPFYTKQIGIALRQKIETGADYRAALTEIPNELGSLIVGRIQEYGPSAFRFLRVGSHVRRQWVYLSDIEEVSGESLDPETIEKMSKAGLITKPPKEKGKEETIQAVDEKIFDILYETTPPDEKKKIHRELGELFERKWKERKTKALLLNTANQYVLSDSPERAVAYLVELGKMEREDGKTETSEEHLRTALEILKIGKDDLNTKGQRLEVLRELGNTYRDMGLHEERRSSQEERLGIVADLRELTQINEYQALIGFGAAVMRTNPDEAIQMFEKGKLLAEQVGDEDFVLHALVGLGTCYLNKSEYEKARSFYNNIINRVPAIDSVHLANAQHRTALTYSNETNYEQAEKHYQLAFSIAERLEKRVVMAIIKNDWAFLESQRGNLNGLLEHSQDALRFSRESGTEEVQIAALANIAYVHLERGEIDLARTYLDEGHQLAFRRPSLKQTSGGRYIEEQIGKPKVLT